MTIEAIRAVLDRAARDGVRFRFWWRDDDAVAATPALDRLLALGRSFQIPIAIAAIPAAIEPSLPARLKDEPGARMLVHGLRHINHAPPGRKAAEFGDGRPYQALLSDAAAGLAFARQCGGDRVLPVFVPPWNRIAPSLTPALHRIGYAGLSVFGSRQAGQNLTVANTHLDPVDWRGSRGAVSPERLAAALERAIASPDPGPIGLLTHHLVFDEALWTLTERLLELVFAHGLARAPTVEEVWRPQTASLNCDRFDDLT